MLSADVLADVRVVLADQWPGYRVNSIARIGEGQENVAFEVNGELIVRFRKESNPGIRAESILQEKRLLAIVADRSPLAVPRPVFASPERGCLGYFKVPGVPMIALPAQRRAAHAQPAARVLGELLAALHAVPLDQVDELVEVDDRPLSEWRADGAAIYERIRPEVPARYRPNVEQFLGASIPGGAHPRVFSHNDLGIEHVLVDPVTVVVSGIIDWSDAAITDPAYDFGLIFRDLGEKTLDAALRRYGEITEADVAALAERAGFYGRCSVLEDLAYAVESAQGDYFDKCTASLAWLFPSAWNPR